MTFHGHVKNGVVVLDGAAELPEGAAVRIELPERAADAPKPDQNGASLAEKLLAYAGQAQGLPPDASLNLDHYLYGTPKR